MKLKDIDYSDLFVVSYFVGTAFQAVLLVIGAICAFLNPAMFRSGSAGAQVPASTPLQALSILLLILIFSQILNLLVASTGSGVLIGIKAMRARLKPGS